MSTLRRGPRSASVPTQRTLPAQERVLHLAGAPVLRPLLPDVVECEEHLGDPPGGELFPAEEAVVRRATDRRRREYATVRACARRCLCRLGHAPGPLLRGPGGAPAWPAGLCGSLTHCEGYAAAAVARDADVVALGIDAEPDAPLPEDVLDVVATPAELGLVGALARAVEGPSWDRLLFSAKEAVFKAWCPRFSCWLDPQETEVVIEPHAGTFTAHLRGEAGRSRPAPVQGRWVRSQGLLVTAVVL